MREEVKVRCYAGSRFPERPVAFERQGTWLEIATVLRSAHLPEGLTFDVLTTTGEHYRLNWHEATDSWQLSELTPQRKAPNHV